MSLFTAGTFFHSADSAILDQIAVDAEKGRLRCLPCRQPDGTLRVDCRFQWSEEITVGVLEVPEFEIRGIKPPHSWLALRDGAHHRLQAFSDSRLMRPLPIDAESRWDDSPLETPTERAWVVHRLAQGGQAYVQCETSYNVDELPSRATVVAKQGVLAYSHEFRFDGMQVGRFAHRFAVLPDLQVDDISAQSDGVVVPLRWWSTPDGKLVVVLEETPTDAYQLKIAGHFEEEARLPALSSSTTQETDLFVYEDLETKCEVVSVQEANPISPKLEVEPGLGGLVGAWRIDARSSSGAALHLAVHSQDVADNPAPNSANSESDTIDHLAGDTMDGLERVRDSDAAIEMMEIEVRQDLFGSQLRKSRLILKPERNSEFELRGVVAEQLVAVTVSGVAVPFWQTDEATWRVVIGCSDQPVIVETRSWKTNHSDSTSIERLRCLLNGRELVPRVVLWKWEGPRIQHHPDLTGLAHVSRFDWQLLRFEELISAASECVRVGSESASESTKRIPPVWQHALRNAHVACEEAIRVAGRQSKTAVSQSERMEELQAIHQSLVAIGAATAKRRGKDRGDVTPLANVSHEMYFVTSGEEQCLVWESNSRWHELGAGQKMVKTALILLGLYLANAVIASRTG